MGCATSKLEEQIIEANQGRLDCKAYNHLVSLTSTTYGLLHSRRELAASGNVSRVVSEAEAIETINTWELMEGLEEEDESHDVASSSEKKNQVTGSCPSTKNVVGSGKEADSGKENEVPRCDFVSVTVERPILGSAKEHSVKKQGTCNAKTELGSRHLLHSPLSELKIQNNDRDGGIEDSFRDCSPVFDPDLLASLESELKSTGHNGQPEDDRAENRGESREEGLQNGPANFEYRCPPGGSGRVVLYTTTLRGIRKTFEECNSVRSVLEGYGVWVSERDVSMHQAFRWELEQLMEERPCTVPKVFIKGWYIGGAEELLGLHEEGALAELLEGIPTDVAGRVCDGCGGLRFVPCLECSGSCKIVDDDSTVFRCPECNENGLIQCPICT